MRSLRDRRRRWLTSWRAFTLLVVVGLGGGAAGVWLTDPARVAGVLAELRSMGVSTAIDDFGAGYTSLLHLSTLPVEELKIDRRFVTNLLDVGADEAVVRSIIHLAHDLGMVSIAEGVESTEVWARLADLGCDAIQGYVLSRPLPPDQITGWLAEWQGAAALGDGRLMAG